MTSNDPRADWAENVDDLGPDTKIYDESHRSELLGLLDGEPAIGGEVEAARRLRAHPVAPPTRSPATEDEM